MPGVDTVFVRPGTYAETPVVGGSVPLLGVSDGSSDLPVIDGLRVPAELWGRYDFQRLQFNRFVVTASDNQSVALSFVQCNLQGGGVDSSGLGSIDGISLGPPIVVEGQACADFRLVEVGPNPPESVAARTVLRTPWTVDAHFAAGREHPERVKVRARHALADTRAVAGPNGPHLAIGRGRDRKISDRDRQGAVGGARGG